MNFRSALLASAAVVVLASATPANAQSGAMPVPFVNWAGFYTGLHTGGAVLNYRQTNIDENGFCGNNPGTVCSDSPTGPVFGGQVGYNFQNGPWVYGLELDASKTFIKDYVTDPSGGHYQAGLDWLASLRVRGGWASGDNFYYATGGVALGGLNSGAWGSGYAATVHETKVGWVAGGGMEHRLSQQWSARIEGLYYDFGKVDAVMNPGGYRTSFEHTVVVGRIGLDYHW